MTTQKALLLSGVNGTWSLVERPVPKPGPGELLVKIHATALNPIDWMGSKYPISFISNFPAIFGTDSAGTVEAVGEGVTSFRVGDRVFHQGYFQNDLATFQEYALVPAEITARLPATISFDEAASLPLGVATAALGLFGARPEGVERYQPLWEGGIGKYSGESIVIFGGASSVGQYAIQLAHMAGFSPIIATASPHNAELLKSLGATHVIDRTSNVREAVANVLRQINAPAPKVVYDAISNASTQPIAWDILAPGGQLNLVHKELVDLEKYKDKHTFVVFGTAHAPENRADGIQLNLKLTEWLENGSLRPNRVEVLSGGLNGILGGLKRLEENKVSALKLIVRPQETA